MSLTALQIQHREGKLTASRVGVLMRGDAEAVHNLWLECIGSPDYVGPDFGDNWAVQLGSHTESLHLDWYAKKHSPVSRRGEVVAHGEFSWAACTLDGWVDKTQSPLECKHVNAYKKFEDVRSWYMPQLAWQAFVCGEDHAILSVIIGASEPVHEHVEIHLDYMQELVRRAKEFWACVESLTPPVALKPVEVPVAPEKWRTVDMTGNNAFATHAADYISTKVHAKLFAECEKELKALVEPDVGTVSGYGLVIKRDKANRLHIKEKSNV